MPRDWSEEERRRADEEEEEHYWASIEEERRKDEEAKAAREAAVEQMIGWFLEQFEDPQNETPRDSEDGDYIFPWGGPFEAGDVLYNAFSGEHDEELILAAVKKIEADGTTLWAPTSSGDYYEHPEEVELEAQVSATAALAAQALERLDALEAIVASLPVRPVQLGHNAPPDDIGLPPYTEEDEREVLSSIAEARAVVTAPEPNAAELATLSRRFEGWGTKIAAWFGKKADLAVDELIKNSVRALTWSQAAAAFTATAEVLLELAKHLLAGR